MKWKAKKVAATAANNIQVDSGLLLWRFDVTNPVEPADEDIICATSGDHKIKATPSTQDFFADVNNAQTNTKEGKRITGWDCGLDVTCLEMTEETIAFSMGAAEVQDDGGIRPRDQYIMEDFKPVYWVGDMVDPDKLLVVVMDDTVSTGGLSFSAKNNGKGELALSLTPHATLGSRKVPICVYVLEKVGEDEPEYEYSAVTTLGSENPKEEGWFVLAGDKYVLTNDTEVDANKTYYERTQTEGV